MNIQSEMPTTFKVGGAVFDTVRRTVTENNFEVTLTSDESKILHLVAVKGGGVAEKDILYADYCSTREVKPEPKIIDVQICKIRKKLGHLSGYLVTVWGKGYFISEKLLNEDPCTVPRKANWKRGLLKKMSATYLAPAPV